MKFDLLTVDGAARRGRLVFARGTVDDSRDGGRSGLSQPSRGITPSLEGRGRTVSGDGRDAGGRATPGAVAGTTVETPAFMPVGTYGTVKSLTPEQVAES